MTLAGSAELHEAINTTWEASSLNADFNDSWAAGESSRFNVLNDGEASPEQPFPYCVFEIEAGSVDVRMSGGDSLNREIRDVPGRFTVYASEIDGDSRTAKEVVADLAEKVMEIFGGHPSTSPEDLTLDNAKHLITLFVSDFGLRKANTVHSWIINYNFRLDVPVAV